MQKKLFDFCIGNPPYQEETLGDNKGYAPPVYNIFMDAAYQVSDKVELIHPARFLFNAGSTPKEWNQKMLQDSHFKVLEYESDSSVFFNGVSIMGGLVISYHDAMATYREIGTFLPYEELRTIREKTISHNSFQSITSIIFIQTRFDLQSLYMDYAEYKDVIGSNGHDDRFEKNIFTKVPIFTESKKNADDIRTLGILDRKRAWLYIPCRYVDKQGNLYGYKAIMSVSNGAAGTIGESPARIAGEPIVGQPNEGFTRSFIGIGNFKTREEAKNCCAYIATKFARTLLGTLKLTQMLNKDVWLNVPLQDFTPSSDIDWSKSVAEIDQQLYAKYGLDEKEKEFIENHVKEMN